MSEEEVIIALSKIIEQKTDLIDQLHILIKEQSRELESIDNQPP
jgi:hypothetical protein